MSDRYAQARATKEGDVWRHLKTGKSLTILAKPRGIFGQVRVRHESGRETAKQAHYLADEYELIEMAAEQDGREDFNDYKVDGHERYTFESREVD